jgi:UDP-GlcNAc:undecaprenyl-phosphate GlcNAc-1-phosphate transferase
MNSLVWAGVIAAGCSFGVTCLVRLAAGRWHQPGRRDDRDSAAPRAPRLGGIAVAVSWLVTIIGVSVIGDPVVREQLGDLPLGAILTAAFLVFAVGLVDDLRPLSAGTKVAVEALAGGLVIGAGVLIATVTLGGTAYQLGGLSVVATLLWLLVVTNAFNLMDGLDGLATGLAIIAGVTCATIVLLRADLATGVLLVALVGALVGFLPHNFNPASIFLGDGGSLFIGFVLALTAVTGFQKGATALAAGVPLLIFALPLLDTAAAVFRRLRGRSSAGASSVRASLWRLLQPDEAHIHHRLMSRGLSHRSTVLVLYAVAIGLSAAAIATAQR